MDISSMPAISNDSAVGLRVTKFQVCLVITGWLGIWAASSKLLLKIALCLPVAFAFNHRPQLRCLTVSCGSPTYLTRGTDVV